MVRVNQVVKDKVSICGDWNLWKAVFVVDLSFSVHFHQSCFQNKWLVVSAHTVGIHFYYRLIWTVAWYLVGVIIWQLDGCDNIWLIAVLNLDACISLSIGLHVHAICYTWCKDCCSTDWINIPVCLLACSLIAHAGARPDTRYEIFIEMQPLKLKWCITLCITWHQVELINKVTQRT